MSVAVGPIVRAAVGIGAYAAAFGASFGAVSVSSGLTLGQTMVLSLVMFSGASQFAFAGLAATGSAWAGLPAALLLGVRNAFYGVALAEALGPRGWRRVVGAHFVVDETTALALAQSSGPARRYAFWACGMILFALWNAGTLAGAAIGGALDPRVLGLDAAVPAVFLALLWPMLRRPGAVPVAVLGVITALALVPVAPAGLPVVAAAAIALVAGLLPARARPEAHG